MIKIRTLEEEHMTKFKQDRCSKKPIEKHNTAAWADIEATEELSNVTVPSREQVKSARDYVNENQK